MTQRNRYATRAPRDTAKKTGKAPRSVQRQTKIGQALKNVAALPVEERPAAIERVRQGKPVEEEGGR